MRTIILQKYLNIEKYNLNKSVRLYNNINTKI